MRCVKCGYVKTGVIDSRGRNDGYTVRRRRECGHCGTKYTTEEAAVGEPAPAAANPRDKGAAGLAETLFAELGWGGDMS